MTLASAPTFCSLEGRQLQDRLVWLAELNREWLRRKKLDGRTLTLIYDKGAESALGELLVRERKCCTVLQFDLMRSETDMQLTITAPVSTGGDVERQLAVFGESQPVADSRCCGACEPPAKTITGRVAGAAAATSVAAALACGACCVLPIAIPAIATGMSGVVVAWFAGSHVWMTVAAALLVMLSWGWVCWKSLKARTGPASSTWALMGLATVAAGAAVLWPHLEPSIIAMIRQ